MPQVDIKLIHDACKAYLADPILKPFEPIDLTKPQRSIDRILGEPNPVIIFPEVLLVSQKRKIVQEILRAHSVVQVADILDRCDHNGLTNRNLLQQTNSMYLSWLLFRMQIDILIHHIKSSSYLACLLIVFPLTQVAAETGSLYVLVITLAVIMMYALLRASYALIQTYQSSIALTVRSEQLIAELEMPATQDYKVEPMSQALKQFGLVYDAEGAWLDQIIANPEQWKDRKLDDGSPILHTLLSCQNPNYSYAIIRKLQQAVLLFSQQKYIRNSRNETPMYVLNHYDMYGFKHLLDIQDSGLFEEQTQKIDLFLESVQVNRKNTKALLLLEGASGTGKSQIIMDYMGKKKSFKVHRWEAGGENDRYVGGLVTRAGNFFSNIMQEAQKNPQEKFLIYLDNIDVICGTKGENTKEWIRALAGQFSHYIDLIRQESTNIIVVGTTRSALEIDSSLLDLSERVRFPLPNVVQRYGLLLHSFMDTLVSSDQLEHLAEIAEGWSHRALVSIASNLDKKTMITDENMEDALEKVRYNLERDFTKLYPHTQIILPKFLKTNAFLNYKIVTPQPIASCLNKLKKYLQHPECYDRTPMHTLLYGPPGGGKTTAIRNFCEEMNLPFLVIKSAISAGHLIKALEAVNEYKYALVFIDEIDSFPHTGELLKQMDGFSANNTILIGATNKPKEVISAGEGALGDRFHFKVFVPGLTQVQRANFIQWKVAKQLERFNGMLQSSDELSEQITRSADCLSLADVSQTLSMRALSNHINSFFGEKRCDAFHRASGDDSASTVSFEALFQELQYISQSQIIMANS